MRFHINDNGPAPCDARPGNCPIGGSHFDNADEADQAFQEQAEAKYNPLQGYVRKDLGLTLEDIRPTEFDTDADGNVLIPEDLRQKFLEEIEQGYIRRSVQLDADGNEEYVMLKYDRTAMYEQRWNEATINARGILASPDLRQVYARGFSKFFNTSEHDGQRLPALDNNEEVIVEKKMDGSMGLIARVKGKYRVFTTGSAQSSEITEKAEEILARVNRDNTFNLPKNHTMLVEIISPVNPIVVDYGEEERLVGLGLMHNTTGQTVPRKEMQKAWKGEIVEQVGGNMPLAQAMTTPIPADEEGYVLVSTKTGFRAKVKGEEYKEAHKILTNTSTKQILMAIKEDRYDEMENTIARLSPGRGLWAIQSAKAEIDKKINAYADGIREKKDAAVKATGITFENATGDDRKRFVEYLQKNVQRDEFSSIISSWQGREDTVRKSALKGIQGSTKTSILSLISAEKSEVGDDMDDQT